jgi:hypothetical protein
MKLTLLDMTQDILASMSGDQVDSITDNSESDAIARIIRSCYYDIVAPEHFPENYDMFQLTASGDSSKPVLMIRPNNVNNIQWIRYNKATLDDTDPMWTEIRYKPLRDFLNYVQGFKLSDSFVDSMSITTMSGSSIQFLYRNDAAPNWYTTYDDDHIVFDSFDSEVDTTLQTIKTQAWGHIGETFQLSDSYVPVIDDSLFPLLLNEAKSLAWQELLKTQHTGAMKKARKHWITSQRTKSAFGNNADAYNALPNYGRSGTPFSTTNIRFR